MIYADTRRAYWAFPLPATRFYGAAISLGVVAVAAVLGWIAAASEQFRAAIIISLLLRSAFFLWETSSGRRAAADPSSPLHRSEQTICALLLWFGPARLGLYAAGTFACALALVVSGPFTMIAVSVALAASLAAHVIERFGFFTAVTAPRMPSSSA